MHPDVWVSRLDLLVAGKKGWQKEVWAWKNYDPDFISS